MMMKIQKKQLIAHLEGLANALENDWQTMEGVYGNLLILLTASGYLKLREEHYVKEVEHGRLSINHNA